jgi:hypothetical protein
VMGGEKGPTVLMRSVECSRCFAIPKSARTNRAFSSLVMYRMFSGWADGRETQ